MRTRLVAGIAKVFLTLALVLGGAVFANMTIMNEATHASCPNANFLNFRPWWHGLRNDSTCELLRPVAQVDAGGTIATTGLGAGNVALTHFVWRVVFNVMDTMLGIVAYGAVLFVLIGGFNIVFSSGDPARLAKGKTTITHALMGAVLAVTGAGIVRFINDALIGSGSHDLRVTANGTVTGGHTVNTSDVWLSATRSLFVVAAIGAVLVVAWGGVKLSMSAGDPQAAAKARNTIIFALIGAVVMLLASIIVGTMYTAVTGTP